MPKTVNCAFIGTDLDLRLRRLGAAGIIMFGMRTDMCVSSTARSGANMGWQTFVVGDACDCCDLADPTSGGLIAAEDAHRIHLATLSDEFAQIVTTQEVVGTLGSTALTPDIL